MGPTRLYKEKGLFIWSFLPSLPLSYIQVSPFVSFSLLFRIWFFPIILGCICFYFSSFSFFPPVLMFIFFFYLWKKYFYHILQDKLVFDIATVHRQWPVVKAARLPAGQSNLKNQMNENSISVKIKPFFLNHNKINNKINNNKKLKKNNKIKRKERKKERKYQHKMEWIQLFQVCFIFENFFDVSVSLCHGSFCCCCFSFDGFFLVK